MEGFAAVLTDGWPLPASSERLNQRGAVITGLPTLLLELRGGRGSVGGGQREQELDGEPAKDDVRRNLGEGEDVGLEKERGGRSCGMEQKRSVLGAAHLTPQSQKALQRGSLHYVKGGKAGGTVYAVLLWLLVHS